MKFDKRMRVKHLLLGIALLISLNGISQITSTAIFSEPTEYSDSAFIFVFCTDDPNGGSLTANDSTGFGGYDFQWYKYNEGTNDFTDVIVSTINNDSTSSDISNLTEGGYRVVLTNADSIQEYEAWIGINIGLDLEMKFHRENDCDFFALEAHPYYGNPPNFDTVLIYHDVLDNSSYTLKNRINTYEWSSSPELDSFNKSGNGSYNSIAEDPFDNNSELPTENTTFSLIVTDRFGCMAEDDIEYEAIETDANFSWTSNDDDAPMGTSESELSGSAPLKVSFINESLNGESFAWFFGDTTSMSNIDTLNTNDYYEEPQHTYYYSVADSGKTYTMRLYSKSKDNCVDSIFFKIKTKPSKIEFPNVFSPTHKDGINDIFHIDSLGEGPISIRDFKITIFNRAGQKVHEYQGNVHDWDGWDGSVRNSGRNAPPGNYFFVVEILGWDNVHYNNNSNWGSPATESNSSNNKASQMTAEGSNESANVQFGVIRLF